MNFKSLPLTKLRIKQALVILTLSLFIIPVNSQINTNRFLISGKISGGLIQKELYTTYGISSEYLIKNRFGLIYNLDGISSKNQFSFHSPMGLTGGSLLIYAGLVSLTDGDPETSGNIGLIGGLICLILPDGISYHQNIGYKWDLSPYANLLGIDFVFNEQRKFETINYACSFGVKTSYLISDNLFCSGYVETRKSGEIPWTFGIGGGLGFTIKHKD